MSSFESVRARGIGLLFALMLFFTFIAGLQEVGAQIVQGAPPTFMQPAEANDVIVQEMHALETELSSVPPGPAATAIGEAMTLYDLIQSNIVELNDVGSAIYAAFGAQYGQVPILYDNGNSDVLIDAGSGTASSIGNISMDAFQPNPTSPGYYNIVTLYNEVVGKLSI